MDTPTSLAAGIDAGSEKPLYDEACKRVLSEKIILAWILKYCVKEYNKTTIKDIAEKYIIGSPEVAKTPVAPDETNVPRIPNTGIEDSTVTEGIVTYDIRFTAVLPDGSSVIKLIVNVEAQDDFYPGYPLIKRAVYYCSRLISSQNGTVFTNSHYEKIQKVYSIWICTSPPKNREYSITEYSFAEKNIVGNVKETLADYDLLSAVMICLGKAPEGSDNKLIDMLNTLLSADINKEDKKKRLAGDFDIPMTEKMVREVDDMCNLSNGVERRGIEKGRVEGRLEGRAEGRAEGRLEGILASVKSLMETMNMTADAAMNALKIPKEDQQEYMSRL